MKEHKLPPVAVSRILEQLWNRNWHWLLYFFPLGIALCTLGFGGFQQWDTLGHLLASRQFSESIWPDFVGWNPNLFGGYPQGFFYPSLFHWLVGSTGRLFDLPICFYLWVVLSLVLLPITAFYALSRAFPSRSDQQWAFLGWCLVFFIPRNPVGGDLYSTIRIGLINQAWALTWFHLFLGRLWSQRSRVSDLKLGWLLGVVILSHAIVGLAGLLLLPWFRRPKFLPPILLVAFLTCAPWAVPFLLKHSYSAGKSLDFFASRNWTADQPQALWLIFGGLLLIVGALLKGWREFRWSPILFRALAGLAIPLSIVQVLYWMDSPVFRNLGAIHWYRMQGFFWALLIPPVFCALGRSLGNGGRSVLVVLGSLLIFSCCGYDCGVARMNEWTARFNFSPDTRVLAHMGSKVGSSSITRISPHFLSDHLGLSGIKTLNGLFAESTPTARYSMATQLEAFRNPMIWGVEALPAYPGLLAKHLRLLGVNYLITNMPIPNPRVATLPLLGEATYAVIPVKVGEELIEEMLFAYPLKGSLVERVDSVTPVRSAEWAQEVHDWWLSASRTDLPVVSDSGVKTETSPMTDDPPPRLKRISDTTLVVETRSEQPAWYLVKEGFFPNWHAIGEDGTSFPVFLAAPNWMAFFGKGRVQLDFKLDPVEKAAQTIGWVMLILGGVLMIWRRGFRPSCPKGPLILALALLFTSGSALGMSRKQNPLIDLKTDLLVMGTFHSCAITAGVVGCWGMNQNGQLGAKPGLHPLRRIRSSGWPEKIVGGGAGLSYTCLHDERRVHCSGRIGSFASTRPALFHKSNSRIDVLKAGAFGFCVWSRTTRELNCFGTLDDRSSLSKISGLKAVEDFSVGSDHLCYRDLAGIHCKGTWIRSTQGFLTVRPLKRQERAGPLVSGPHQVCFTWESKAGGSGLYCWGRRGQEMFGQESIASGEDLRRVLSPGGTSGLNGPALPAKYAVGDLHLCAIWNSQVYCLGDNSEDQAHLARPDETVLFLDHWQKAPLLTGVSDVMASATSTCALVEGFRACWGFLGNGPSP